MTTNECDCGRPAPDATICPLCARDLEELLRSVTGWLHDLDVARVASVSASKLGRIRGGETPMPCRADIVALVDQLRHDIDWWTTYVANARRERRPARLLAPWWLANRHGFIARDDDAMALLDVLDEHRRAVQRIVDLPTLRHVHVGACPYPQCTGTISAELHDSRPLALVCNGCEYVWQAHQLRRLSRQMAHAVR